MSCSIQRWTRFCGKEALRGKIVADKWVTSIRGKGRVVGQRGYFPTHYPENDSFEYATMC
ncbi:hypothetical protein DPMN_001957 [Dreissena polymorpha]|uniref:Uncharacterized protein n=1 Tax=Dreissena polymorpha TaxID=45954 RepID=A0A9D4MIS2_DREPO|nr:hypothetical protein DPMN_001957 [Dreissena polymorpha]